MFEPPFCPGGACPRFRCRTRDRGHQLWTFRADDGDRRPGVNMAALTHISSGVGVRLTARTAYPPRA